MLYFMAKVQLFHSTNFNTILYNEILRFLFSLVMGRAPFYRTSIELEHHFSNIKRSRTCSTFGTRIRIPYLWLRKTEHRTSNVVRPVTGIEVLYSNSAIMRDYCKRNITLEKIAKLEKCAMSHILLCLNIWRFGGYEVSCRLLVSAVFCFVCVFIVAQASLV